MITPTVLDILAVVAPIATSILSNSNDKNSGNCITENPICVKETPVINLTINNNFYVSPSEKALKSVMDIDSKIIEEFSTIGDVK